jgi:tRNA modification GTPase
VPGTTRDTFEETLNLSGVPVVLVDTAGLNDQARDLAEQLGIERSRRALCEADLVLWVIDGSEALTEADCSTARLLGDRPVLVVINKADLPAVADVSRLFPSSRSLHVSALSAQGLHELEDAMLDMILGGKVTASDVPLVNNRRHKAALERALGHLEAAEGACAACLPADFITIDLAAACDALGEITGESVTEDLLETIFSHFCIGK